MADKKPFVTTITPEQGKLLRSELDARGCDLSQPEYTFFQAKKPGLSCTMYTSGKLVIQGKDAEEFIQYYLEPEVLQSVGGDDPSLDLTPRMGIDESGKGDVFGPLCVAGVYADAEGIAWLKSIGAADSKTLKDPKIHDLARKIRQRIMHQVVRINPPKYNEIYPKFGNLNSMLAWGHATAIEHLHQKSGCKVVIVDQFASEHVVENALKRKKIVLDLRQRPRAEEDVVVAAASILARDDFVQALEKLSKDFGITLYKGAGSPVLKAGREFVRMHGADALPKVAKMHFKTTAQFQ